MTVKNTENSIIQNRTGRIRLPDLLIADLNLENKLGIKLTRYAAVPGRQ